MNESSVHGHPDPTDQAARGGTSKDCPRCGLTNTRDATRCDCGYNFGAAIRPPSADDHVSKASVGIDPATAHTVRLAWIVALIWGGISVVLGAIGPSGLLGLEQSVGAGLIGLLVIGLGLAVRRGDALAAWCLVAVAVGEVAFRLWKGVTGGLVWPIVFLAVFLRAALHLRKHRSADPGDEAWVRILYELALLQGLWTAVVIAWSFTAEPATLELLLGRRLNIMNILDVAILIGLAFAAWKRQVWAGYSLAIYQLGNLYLEIQRATPPTDLFAPLGFVFIYGLGAFRLHRVRGLMTRWGYGAIAATAVLMIAALLSWQLNRPIPSSYQRLIQQFTNRLLAIPGYKERLLVSKSGPVRSASEISIKGARRLTDIQLIERATLMGVILVALDEHNCAEQLRGGRGTIEPALPQIPEAALRRWLDLSYAATLAEIENNSSVVPNPSDEAIATAMAAIVEVLSEDDAARFMRVAAEGETSFEGVNDSKACWFLRTIVHSLQSLKPADRATIARVLVAQ